MKIFHIFFFFLFISCVQKEANYNLSYLYNKSFHERFLHYSKKFLGVKYPKKDPVQDKYYNLNEMNCLTYIQNLLALSISKNFQEFEKNIIITSYYKENKPDFLLDRYHFTTDYIEKNAKYFDDITGKIIPTKYLSKRKIKINYNNFFKLHNVDLNLPFKTITLNYLNKNQFLKQENLIKKTLQKDQLYIVLFLPTQEYFEFVKDKNNIEIDIHHLGILYLKNDQIYLRHAGFLSKTFKEFDLKELNKMKIEDYLNFIKSLNGEITEISFNEYIKFSRLLDGMMFIKLKNYENNN